MEENKTNSTNLDLEKAKKEELLKELDKLMFNTTKEEKTFVGPKTEVQKKKKLLLV